MVKVKRALISVSDKRNLEEFVKGLNSFGVELLSTGGTARAIAELDIPVRQVSDYTGFPEMLDGRVKTLHPKIHGALLALRENPEHMDQLKRHNIGLIDMVVVNLYPFEDVAKKEGVGLDPSLRPLLEMYQEGLPLWVKDGKVYPSGLEEAVENIDIGGPSMLRSGAKNFRSVAVICNPGRYAVVLNEMKKNNGSIGDKTLEKLAVEVFEHTSRYDAAIAEYLGSNLGVSECQSVRESESQSVKVSEFPKKLNLQFTKAQDLRYGENPHQKAAFYKDEAIDEPGVSSARHLHGKELSFNNILDLNAAIEIVKDFKGPAACIIKHTNPCGAAAGKTLKKAFIDALNTDRLSAFGCIVGLNKAVDTKTAEAIVGEADFVECIIAPSYTPEALEMLKTKKNLRLLEVLNFGTARSGTAPYIGKIDLDMKKVVGGLLVQDRDIAGDFEKKVVTKKRLTKAQLESLLFGWEIARHVKSNAIVLTKGTRTVGVGAGQMSRVDAVIIAARKAGGLSRGSCLASDAFFPKEDAVGMAKKAGVSAIIQPGGSIRDKEVIKAADKAGLAMVFTGVRHFKH